MPNSVKTFYRSKSRRDEIFHPYGIFNIWMVLILQIFRAVGTFFIYLSTYYGGLYIFSNLFFTGVIFKQRIHATPTHYIMNNLTTRFISIILILLVFVEIEKLSAQCTPPMSQTCDSVQVICSLDELNGYTCSNTSLIPSHCMPLCSQGGKGINTSWWGFVTQGGNVQIYLTVGSCVKNLGIRYGIWGDCVCQEEVSCRSIPCTPPGSVNVINANLAACKTYYLWVDGCSGDICDFTLNTDAGGPPSLSPIGFINNKANMIIEPVCEGACNVLLFVNPQPGGCEPTYVWTLDGDQVGDNANEIRLDFADTGDFVICVTAYIGNPISGSVCSQEGPKCATVKVRPIADRNGPPRTICWEAANPGGYKWHSQRIFTSGTYREQFTDANCCKFDSIVDFIVLDIPEPADVYYITCDNEPYIDLLGRPWDPCKNQYHIMLPKTTDPFKCDSSINLTAVSIEFSPRWRVQCIGGQVEISPNISILRPCSVGETYEFAYKWYRKSDAAKKTLSTDERLSVDAVNEDYCLEVNVKVQLETEFALCAKTFCETYNEGDLAPKSFPLTGDFVSCVNGIGTYWIDTFISQRVNFYTWTIDGGFVTSKVDSQAVEVKWLLTPGDTGTVCVFYDTDCGTSPERCIKVSFASESAGKDFKQRGVIAKLNSPSLKSGFWEKVSGPGDAIFEKITNPKSRVRVDEYGVYCFEWSVSSPSCVSKDTVCIEFYKIKITNPDSPKKVFDDRNAFSYEEEYFPIEIFTPNLISNSGTSFISIDGEINTAVNYHWFDIYGKTIFNENILLEPGIPRVNINSPLQDGFYFLLIEINGLPTVRKICVMK